MDYIKKYHGSNFHLDENIELYNLFPEFYRFSLQSWKLNTDLTQEINDSYGIFHLNYRKFVLNREFAQLKDKVILYSEKETMECYKRLPKDESQYMELAKVIVSNYKFKNFI